MARFFIVDHSLRSTGEHHFDFTTCLSEAGNEMGFEVVVATNRRFKPPTSLSRTCEVRPIFAHTAYEGPSYLAGMERMQRRDFSEHRTSGDLSWLKWMGNRWRHSRFQRSRVRFENRFFDDCERLFTGVHFTDQDHVLFAAVSELEVMASAKFLARAPRTLPGNWHWLFHFPVFEPPPVSCGKQQARQRELQRYLAAARSLLPYHQVHFYTTTEGLAEQYSRLRFADISSIPYPISARFAPQMEQPNRDAHAPMRIVCPGAVRREKGQRNFVQDLVAAIQSPQMELGPIQLSLQVAKRHRSKWISNLAGCSAAESFSLITKPSTTANEKPAIALFDHPLPPDDYARLIEDSDCGLLMYDSRDYLVRRAGILGELLAKGRPVIVSAANWLAEQLKEPHFQYAARLAKGQLAKRQLRLEDGRWNNSNVPLPGGVISFDRERHPFQIEFPSQSDEGGFVLQFQWQGQPEQSDYVRVDVLDEQAAILHSQVIGRPENSELASVFFRNDMASTSINLRFRNAASDSMLGLRNVALVKLDCGARALPLGVVGLVAADQSQLPEMIREMVRHYEHYRLTASQLAPRWYAAHRPMATLASLLATAERSVKAA